MTSLNTIIASSKGDEDDFWTTILSDRSAAWDEDSSESEPIYYEYNQDPLSVLVDQKSSGHDWFGLLRDTQRLNDIAVDPESKELADAIRSYYRNKLMLRRLTNKPLSSFMEVVESIINEPLKLHDRSFPALVKMKDFYREDTETDKILKTLNSVDMNSSVCHTTQIIEFIGSVDRNSRAERTTFYYFKNDENQAIKLISNRKDFSGALFDFISREHSQLGISCTLIPSPIAGREFNCWVPRSVTEIEFFTP